MSTTAWLANSQASVNVTAKGGRLARLRGPIQSLMRYRALAWLLQPDADGAILADHRGWGWLPILAGVDSLALLLLAAANNGSRLGYTDWPPLLFWLCLLAIFVPAAVRLLSLRASRQERLGLVVLVGLALYLGKILNSPGSFTYFDEFLHWETANDILQTHHLFAVNSLLPISPLYPGLELVTTALVRLTGFSVFEAGLLIIGSARLIVMLALFLLYEEVSRSPRLAGLGALLYACHSNFMFFSVEFSYESLALPLATYVLFMVARRERRRDGNILRLVLLILLVIPMVAITHHLTGYALTGLLGLWAVLAFVRNRGRRGWLVLALIAAVAGVASGGWTRYVGNATSGYLEPVLNGGLSALLNLIGGEATGRQLFQGSAGQVAPTWERLVALGAVGFIMLVLPIGLLQIWTRYRRIVPALGLGALVFAYPVMQVFRLTARGWEMSNRSQEFLFWGIGFVLACAVTGWLRPGTLLYSRFGRVAFVGWITVIFMGGVLAGWPPWGRLPGPYLVGADGRSFDPQSYSAAAWAANNLGPDNRISADRDNTLLMATYGRQRPITHLSDNVTIWDVYYAPQISSTERNLLKSAGVSYVVVDKRMSMALPLLGMYFEAGEPEPSINGVRQVIPLSALEKFSTAGDVSCLYDSGAILICDVSKLYDASLN